MTDEVAPELEAELHEVQHMVSRERLSRTDVADSRALLEHARMRHREALAS